MTSLKHMAVEAADYVRRRTGTGPATGILTGTGIGEVTQALEVAQALEYAEIPHFPVATVPSHAGRLLFGEIGRRSIALMQGRFHLYEGYSPAQVTFPSRVMQELGVRRLVVTNAAGGIRPGWAAGELMLITDHINLTGENPLVGPNEESWGKRFPDMTRAYDPGLLVQAEKAAAAAGISARKGVYAGLKGPSLETPAEIRFLRTIGADAVGLSTVQEVIAAIHAGIQVLGISIISNIADPDHPAPACLEEIIAVARGSTPALTRLLGNFLEDLDGNENG
jgi:purine-nucleoside phosphorylase